MSNLSILPLPTSVTTMPTQELIETRKKETAMVSIGKSIKARKRITIVQEALHKMKQNNWTANKAAKHLHIIMQSKQHPLHQSAIELGKSNSIVCEVTIRRWINAYLKKGSDSLIDGRQGRKKLDEGWELRAKQIFNSPQQRGVQLVLDMLLEEGFNTNYHKVRRYINSLPTNESTFSNKRLGAKYNANNNNKYHLMDDSNVPVGFCYQGDGHQCDVYVAHPNTGDIFRPELTAWIDIKSRYIPGFWLGEVENSTDTLFALSHALVSHDHTPSLLHIDNGAGYKSHMLNKEHVGFYERFSMDTRFAWPSNSKGKGRIERFFKTFEIKFGKRFDTYCGADMASDVLRDITIGVKKGTYTLPSFEEYKQKVREWIHTYNHTPHRSLGGKTPAETWSKLQRVELITPHEAVVLPVALRKVRRTGVSIDNRIYRNDMLIGYEGKQVQVQYSMHSDHMVTIRTLDGYFVCDATLASKTPYIPDSRIQEGKLKSLKGKEKRLDIKRDEHRKRALLSLDVEPNLTTIEDTTVTLEQLSAEDEPTITLDVTDTSWAEGDD